MQQFSLNDKEIELKKACLLDFYVTQYWWAAKERCFSSEQISTFFTIIYNLLNNLKGSEINKNYIFVKMLIYFLMTN